MRACSVRVLTSTYVHATCLSAHIYVCTCMHMHGYARMQLHLLDSFMFFGCSSLSLSDAHPGIYVYMCNQYIYIYIYTYIYIYIYGTPPSYKHGVKLKARARTWATRIPRACLTSFDRQVRAYSCCVPLLPRRQPEISYRP